MIQRFELSENIYGPCMEKHPSGSYILYSDFEDIIMDIEADIDTYLHNIKVEVDNYLNVKTYLK